MAVCRHCKTRSGNYARGLCGVCWADVAIRVQHPAARPATYANKDQALRAKRLPALAERAAAGVSLFG